ncbi:MAG: FAD-linked oxidase [Flavobacteriaceae bacterium]|nr:MAG: FAD-linked oxidase [Flavobacteriaceae bacterium]
MKPNLKEISNWGNYPKISAQVYKPRTLDEVSTFIQNCKNQNLTFVASGNMRCYGDANLSPISLSLLELNKWITFDREKGVIKVQSGVLLRDILQTIVPAGFFLPVTPGTNLITIGGAVASDVHGKNHHKEGCISSFVLSMGIADESGEILICNPSQNQELFWSTFGGMGLTGVVCWVELKLKRIETTYIKQEAIQCQNLKEIFHELEASENWTYTVAWIDCLQSGKNLGRSILLRGEHARLDELPKEKSTDPLSVSKGLTLNVPFYFPSFVLNKWTVKAFNFLYFYKQLTRFKSSLVSYVGFFYPLDAISSWNRIYGKKGFIQYQMVIPKNHGEAGMKELLAAISKSGNASFLAVLKLFGKSNPNTFNAFPQEGYTLALDFKINKTLPNLVRTLDSIVMKYGGRIYRAKDSMSNPKLTDYLQNTKQEVFDSDQNRRIKNLKLFQIKNQNHETTLDIRD